MQLSSEPKNMLPQDSKMLAEMIALSPFVFQTAVNLRDLGILRKLLETPDGASLEILQQAAGLTKYSAEVLLDAGESALLVEKNASGNYMITGVGRFIEKDKITRVHMDFSKDVCWEGMAHLNESLRTNKPVGLKVFGKWNTIYEGLLQLPAQVQKSWFAYDHFFSDESVPRALPVVFKDAPKQIMDVGGNTGKFAEACVRYDASVQVTVVDHPAQTRAAEENLAAKGLAANARFAPMDIQDPASKLPEGADVIWMSQFLDCFSEDDVVRILIKARNAMGPSTKLMIMEPLTDSQKFSVARFCLDMVSLYFTAMANGQSRFYRKTDFERMIKKAELELVEVHDQVRAIHSVLVCRRPS